MRLSKKGKITQRAISRALMLGLPVAGLLVSAGCEKKEKRAVIVDEEQIRKCVDKEQILRRIAGDPPAGRIRADREKDQK